MPRTPRESTLESSTEGVTPISHHAAVRPNSKLKDTRRHSSLQHLVPAVEKAALKAKTPIRLIPAEKITTISSSSSSSSQRENLKSVIVNSINHEKNPLMTPSPEESTNLLLYQGTIFKYNGRFEGWKKRHFELYDDGKLIYFRRGRKRKEINVLDIIITLYKKDPCRFEMDTGQIVLHLRTEKSSDRDEWIGALQMMQSDSEKVNLNPRPTDGQLSPNDPSSSMNDQINEPNQEQDKGPLPNGNGDKEDQRSAQWLKSTLSSLDIQLATLKQQWLTCQESHLAIQHQLRLLNSSSTSSNFSQPITKSSGRKVHRRSSSSNHWSLTIQDVKFTDLIRNVDQNLSQWLSTSQQLLSHISLHHYDIEKYISKHPLLIADPPSHPIKDQEPTHIPDPPAPMLKKTSLTTTTTLPKRSFLIIHQNNQSDSDNSDSDDYFDTEGVGSGASEDDDPNETNPDLESSSSSPPSAALQHLNNRSTSLLLRQKTVLSVPSRASQMLFIKTPIAIYWSQTFQTVPKNFQPRCQLPYDKIKGGGPSLMKILKDAIGKDLSRITIPVQYSEPINMLQRLCEDFEYSKNLDKAANEPDSMKRLVLIAGFAASSYASTINRVYKPFNPILGETFEWVNREQGFRLLTEQVCHHPPVAACIVENPKWMIQSCAHVKNKFWGKSIEIFPVGTISCRLFEYHDEFTWNKVTTCVNNVLVGTKWIDNYGEMTLINKRTMEKCILNFQKRGWWDAHAYEITGAAYTKNDVMVYRIEGHWHDEISAIPVSPEGVATGESPMVVWKRHPLPEQAEKQYNFSYYACKLNELPDWLIPHLPRTDSRLRPDQRAMENGDYDLAASEKSRLEEKQREARKVLESENRNQSSNWFSKDTNDEWAYQGGYWESRHSKEWPSRLPDLF